LDSMRPALAGRMPLIRFARPPPRGERNEEIRACLSRGCDGSVTSDALRGCNTVRVNKPQHVDTDAIRARVADHILRNELIPPGGDVVALVSGGPDSTCLWHLLSVLGYRVDALHVNHGLRGAESDEDARFCRETLGADVLDAPPPQRVTENALRDLRYSFASDRLRATGHTASDQVETVLYRLVASGSAKAIKPKREDGVVRPLLPLWREETEAY
jgi:tRNA(Ile)-lysidine synthase TilS/MesJ